MYASQSRKICIESGCECLNEVHDASLERNDVINIFPKQVIDVKVEEGVQTIRIQLD